MFKRNKVDLPIVWVHIDMLHAGANALLNTARTKHETGQSYKLSVNVSRDGTGAVIKIAGANKDWAVGLGSSPLVKAVYDHTDHADARALVTTVEWLPLQE